MNMYGCVCIYVFVNLSSLISLNTKIYIYLYCITFCLYMSIYEYVYVCIFVNTQKYYFIYKNFATILK